MLWIKSHPQSHLFWGTGGWWELHTQEFPGTSSAVLHTEVTAPLPGAAPSSLARNSGQPAGKKGTLSHYRVQRFFLLLPSSLPFPLGFIQASESLPWLHFSQIKNPIVKMDSSVLLPFLPGSSLNPQTGAEGKRGAFPSPGSSRSQCHSLPLYLLQTIPSIFFLPSYLATGSKQHC